MSGEKAFVESQSLKEEIKETRDGQATADAERFTAIGRER